jgi:hypothetical protein
VGERDKITKKCFGSHHRRQVAVVSGGDASSELLHALLVADGASCRGDMARGERHM